MGVLKNVSTGDTRVLEHEHLVGRSPNCNLQIAQSYVSLQHAAIRWVGDRWHVRDLGSRNGTWLGDQALVPGATTPLKKGMRIKFARSEQTWELVDDTPPCPSLIAISDPRKTILVDSDVIALPNPDAPHATIFRSKDGSWKLEKEDEVVSLVSGQVFELLGAAWRFSSSMRVSDTSKTDWPEHIAQRLSGATLVFKVSSDEEHVEIELKRDGQSFDLGGRAHNYLLLCLARQRLADAEAGVADASAGWIHRDDFLQGLKMDREHLNIAIFRIRKQFERSGLKDAASVIERRPTAQQLRIGLANLEVHTI